MVLKLFPGFSPCVVGEAIGLTSLIRDVARLAIAALGFK
jgi:hypothetical protein